jgi:hypothetical protein
MSIFCVTVIAASKHLILRGQGADCGPVGNGRVPNQILSDTMDAAAGDEMEP